MFKRALLLTVLMSSTAVMAACIKPASPALPDAETAVTAQMVMAKNQINAYIADAEVYLKCVKNNNRKRDRMIDEMQEAADNFNAIVRAYRKRMAS